MEERNFRTKSFAKCDLDTRRSLKDVFGEARAQKVAIESAYYQV